MTKAKTGSGLAAAIDVGSHETVLAVAQLHTGRLPRTVEVVQRTLPLGADTYTRGEIRQPLLNQLVEILLSFREKLQEYGGITVDVAATSAFREAANAMYAIEQIRRLTGYRVRVLANSEETSLHLLGMAATLEDYEKLIQDTTLILDIRAGSIQLTLYDQGELVNSLNFRIGALRVRELLGELERHALDYSALLAEYIRGDLNYYTTLSPKRTTYQNLIVVGSNLRFLRHLASLPEAQTLIRADELSGYVHRLQTLEGEDRARLLRIPEEHRSLLLPTAIIVDEVVQYVGVQEFLAPDFNLVDGMLLDQAMREYGLRVPYDVEADLVSAAQQLARRYRTDKRHAGHVENLALRLFDLTKKLHGLGRRERLILRLAAILHNVGKYVALQDDERRTMLIIESNDLVGLSEGDRHLVALLAGYHNGHVSHQHYDIRTLPADDRLMLMKLIAILALANSLDASHEGKIALEKARVADGQLILGYSAEKDETLELWHVRNHQGPFEDVFGLRPTLVRRGRREKS